MGKKKKQEIDLSNIKTVRLEINFSVPKEQVWWTTSNDGAHWGRENTGSSRRKERGK